ncbi:MAG: hypothetical protein RLZZ336_1865, partial [Cyanobacteriota bacterium]
MPDPQLDRELEQARRHGRWLADDELAALDAQHQQTLEQDQGQRQTRRKLILLTGICLLLPPLWPLALGLTLYLLFPRTTQRFGLIAGILLLIAGVLLAVLLLGLVVAIL